MSDLSDRERRDIENNTPSAATTDAMLGLGAAAIGFAMSQAEKSRIKKLEEELRTRKPKWYFSHTIVGVTCPSCLSVTEEGQWCCHMCGASLA